MLHTISLPHTLVTLLIPVLILSLLYTYAYFTHSCTHTHLAAAYSHYFTHTLFTHTLFTHSLTIVHIRLLYAFLHVCPFRCRRLSLLYSYSHYFTRSTLTREKIERVNLFASLSLSLSFSLPHTLITLLILALLHSLYPHARESRASESLCCIPISLPHTLVTLLIPVAIPSLLCTYVYSTHSCTHTHLVAAYSRYFTYFCIHTLMTVHIRLLYSFLYAYSHYCTLMHVCTLTHMCTLTHIFITVRILALQPIAFGVSLNLNVQSQSPWSLFNGTSLKRPRELDHQLRIENEEMTLQSQ